MIDEVYDMMLDMGLDVDNNASQDQLIFYGITRPYYLTFFPDGTMELDSPMMSSVEVFDSIDELEDWLIDFWHNDMHNEIAYHNHEELMDMMERAGLPKVHDETWHNNVVPSVSTTISGEYYEVFVPDDDEVYTYAIMDEYDVIEEFDDPGDVIAWLKRL